MTPSRSSSGRDAPVGRPTLVDELDTPGGAGAETATPSGPASSRSSDEVEAPVRPLTSADEPDEPDEPAGADATSDGRTTYTAVAPAKIARAMRTTLRRRRAVADRDARWSMPPLSTDGRCGGE
jgi:hypothetical protein